MQGVHSGASLAGISSDLIKEAMQGVVAALAAEAQKGGVEGLPASALGDVVSAATQPVNPGGATVSICGHRLATGFANAIGCWVSAKT
jgi:hypothetical protein